MQSCWGHRTFHVGLQFGAHLAAVRGPAWIHAWWLDSGPRRHSGLLGVGCTPRQSVHGEGHRPLGHGDAFELLGMEAGPTPSRIHAQVTGPSSPAPRQWCCPDLLHGPLRLSWGGEHPAPGRPQLQLWEPALFSSRCGCPHPVPARLSASGAGDFQGKMKKNHSIISWLGDRELSPALLTLLQGLPSLTPH